MSAVLNVITREPRPALGGDGEASFGNYSLREVHLAGTGPIASSRLLASVAGAYLARDGFTINDLNGDDVDSRDSLAGRVRLTLRASL